MTRANPNSRAPELKFTALDLGQAQKDGAFEGYASLFGREDLARDVITPGAFRQSLTERGAGGIRMLFQHDANQPIGVWTSLQEDARGLYAKGQLSLDVPKAREALALMRDRALDGLSIGFKALKFRRDAKGETRRIDQIDLWEISIVTFPMMPDARVSRVKSQTFAGALPTEREFERWLTRDAGFTRSEARAVLRSGFKGLQTLRDAGEGDGELERLGSQIRQATKLLRSMI